MYYVRDVNGHGQTHPAHIRTYISVYVIHICILYIHILLVVVSIAYKLYDHYELSILYCVVVKLLHALLLQ